MSCLSLRLRRRCCIGRSGIKDDKEGRWMELEQLYVMRQLFDIARDFSLSQLKFYSLRRTRRIGENVLIWYRWRSVAPARLLRIRIVSTTWLCRETFRFSSRVIGVSIFYATHDMILDEWAHNQHQLITATCCTTCRDRSSATRIINPRGCRPSPAMTWGWLCLQNRIEVNCRLWSGCLSASQPTATRRMSIN